MALNTNARKSGRGRTNGTAKPISIPSDRNHHQGAGRPKSELTELVEEAVAETESLIEAANALLFKVKPRPDLYAELMAGHEFAAARAAVGVRVSRQRREIWSGPTVAYERPSAPDARVGALVRSNVTALLDWPIPGGKRLGDANAAELREGAALYIGNGTMMINRGRWLERIAAALPEGKTVSEKFSEAELAEMKEASKC